MERACATQVMIHHADVVVQYCEVDQNGRAGCQVETARACDVRPGGHMKARTDADQRSACYYIGGCGSGPVHALQYYCALTHQSKSQCVADQCMLLLSIGG